MSVILIYVLSGVFGLSLAVHLGQVNLSTSLRLMAGGVGGSVGSALYSNGGGFAIIALCFKGAFGGVGYFFAASLVGLVGVWAYNLTREGRAIL